MNTDKRKALGRGLDALLPTSRPTPSANAAPAADQSGTREIELDKIDGNPYQTRRSVDEISLAELAASIAQTGVLQPVLVRPVEGGRFQLIAGERRWMASRRAGKTSIPAIVKQVSNEQAMEITIIENLQREDLNAMEQARAYERLSREFNLTQEQMAQRTGKDRASVSNFLRLLKLPGIVQQALESGLLSFGHGKVLMMLANEPAEVMERAAQRVISLSLSVRQTEEMIYRIMGPRPEKAVKKRMVDPNVKDAELAIQSTLGCKVQIEDRGGKGRIVLEYAGIDHFEAIMAAIGAKPR